MEFQLRYRKGEGEWQNISLPEGNLRIGRRSNCDLQLSGSLVSRDHSEIRRRGDRVWIVDLGSSNGTRLDGNLLQEQLPQPILPSQTIRIGEYSLQLVISMVPAKSDETLLQARDGHGHVFVSYSRRDKDLVNPLVAKLRASGVNVWIDTQDIKPGAPWKGQIVQSIAESDSFVLLLSRDSCASENVRKELDLAIEADVLVLPVILQPVDVTAALKYQLVGIQRINLFSDPEAGFAQLLAGIRERQAYLNVHPREYPKEMQAEVVLPAVTISEFYREKQQQLLNFLAQVTNTSPSAFSIASATAGSVRVIVNMPASAAYELKAQALNGNPALIAAGISILRLVGDQQFIQIGGTFPPGGTAPSQPLDGPPTSGPPSDISPPTALPGGGILRILLWTVGVVGLVVIGVLAAHRLAPPEIPPTHVPHPTAIHNQTIEPSQTPRPKLTSTRKSTQLKTARPTATRTKTPTDRPTATRTNPPTKMPTATWTPSETAFVCAPYLVLEMNAHCREGPATVYDIVTSLLAGQNVSIEGKNDNQSIRWWWVQLPNSRAHCWISDSTARTYGEPECVRVIPAPPTPTPTVSPPPAPLATSPVNNEWVDCFYDNPVSINWSSVSSSRGIDHYEWVVEMADSFGAFSVDQSGSTSGTAVSVDISCSADYRWRVRAVDGTGVAGEYSDFAFFTTN